MTPSGNRTRNLPACSAVPQPTAPQNDSVEQEKQKNTGRGNAEKEVTLGGKKQEVTAESDGKTISWVKVDGTRFISQKRELSSITRTAYFPIAQTTVPQVAQLLRQCATSREVAGSIFH